MRPYLGEEKKKKNKKCGNKRKSEKKRKWNLTICVRSFIFILTFFAIFTAGDNTFAFFIACPVLLACNTITTGGACGTASRTRYAFLALFISIVCVWASI